MIHDHIISTVLAALIAAGAALLGAFLGPFTDSLKGKRAMKQKVWEERHICYSEFIQRYSLFVSAMNVYQAVRDERHRKDMEDTYTNFNTAYCKAILICETVNIPTLSGYFQEVQKVANTQQIPQSLMPKYRAAVEAMRKELLPDKTIFKRICEFIYRKLHS